MSYNLRTSYPVRWIFMDTNVAFALDLAARLLNSDDNLWLRRG